MLVKEAQPEGPAVQQGTLMDLCKWLRQQYSSLPASIRIPEVLHVQSKKNRIEFLDIFDNTESLSAMTVMSSAMPGLR